MLPKLRSLLGGPLLRDHFTLQVGPFYMTITNPRTVVHTLAYGSLSDTKAQGFRATWRLQIDSLSVAKRNSR